MSVVGRTNEQRNEMKNKYSFIKLKNLFYINRYCSDNDVTNYDEVVKNRFQSVFISVFNERCSTCIQLSRRWSLVVV